MLQVSLNPFLVLVKADHHQAHQAFIADGLVPITYALALVKGKREIADKTTHSNLFEQRFWLIKFKNWQLCYRVGTVIYLK